MTSNLEQAHGRRSFLQLGGAGIAAAAIGSSRTGGPSGQSSKQRSTERLVRRFFRAIESGSTSAIWDFFARDGAIEFPFLGTRYTDFASFDAAVGPLLAVLPGLTFTDPVLEFLDDPEALIAKYRAMLSSRSPASRTTRPTSSRSTPGMARSRTTPSTSTRRYSTRRSRHRALGRRARLVCSRPAATRDEHYTMTSPSEHARHAPIIMIEEPGRQPLLVVVVHPVEIGRECSGIVLTDLAISRKHLLAVAHGNTVRDHRSRHDERVARSVMAHSSRIISCESEMLVRFGACTLSLVAEGSAEMTPPKQTRARRRELIRRSTVCARRRSTSSRTR